MLVLVVSAVLQRFPALFRCCGASRTWRRAPSTASLGWQLLLGCGMLAEWLSPNHCPATSRPHSACPERLWMALGWHMGARTFPCACFGALGEVGGGGWPGWTLPGRGGHRWLRALARFPSCPHSHVVLVRPRCLCEPSLGSSVPQPPGSTAHIWCAGPSGMEERRGCPWNGVRQERRWQGLEMEWGAGRQRLNGGHGQSTTGPSSQ